MANFEIKRRDAKTGNKKERTVRKLSGAEVRAGQWARGGTGPTHHFFIEGMSVCGRPLPDKMISDTTRKLCPECYAAVNLATAHGGLNDF